jgi:hypothetical protein
MTLRLAMIAALTLLLTACGDSVSGTYTDATGVTSYEFDGGEVVMTVAVMGQRVENRGTYTVDGDRIQIQFTSPMPATTYVTRDDDGNLIAPMGGILTKE